MKNNTMKTTTTLREIFNGETPASCLTRGDRIVDDSGFIQEIVSISPYSTWGLLIETTYSRDHGGMKMVLDKTATIEVTFDEPHGPDNPHRG